MLSAGLTDTATGARIALLVVAVSSHRSCISSFRPFIFSRRPALFSLRHADARRTSFAALKSPAMPSFRVAAGLFRPRLRGTLATRAAIATAGILVLLLAPPAPGAEPVAPPNVLLILADDMGWGDVTSHGNSQIATPTLDRLAADGATFRHFYVSPVCAPTRAALLTGRYAPRGGVHGVTRAHETLRADEVTLAEVFHAAGYATGCFGKWHNGAHLPNHPNGQGFDEFVGFCAGHLNNYFSPPLEHNGTLIRPAGYVTDVLTDAAIDFIGGHRDTPFFCYLPYNVPHWPPQVPDADFNRCKARGLDDETAAAYAMVENMDAAIARLLAALDESDLAQRTIVLFLSDNGANSDRYDGNMRGQKGSLHEGGSRVPLFVRWPGRIARGTTIEPIAAHIDLLPTLCELCNIAPPAGRTLDGISLVPLLRGTPEPWDSRNLFTFKDWMPQPDGFQGAVRSPRWRAVREDKRGWQLYNMQTDPAEAHDVAAEHPAVVKSLAAAYQTEWQAVSAEGFAAVPVAIGLPQRPAVTLPAHEANLHPRAGRGIAYHGPNGWANDWIDSWTDQTATASWPVEVVTPGNYEIVLHYTCPPEQVGSRFRVEIANAAVAASVTQPHNPDPLPSPDRFSRGEVYEKPWKPLSLGVLQLPVGRADVLLRAEQMAGDRMPQVKEIEIRPVP